MTARAYYDGKRSVGVCTGCDLRRDHPDITHRPYGHAVWCVWTSCGHHIQRGHTACTKEHPPEERNTVSEPTETPPAKKASARPKKTAAPPPEPGPQPPFTPAQQRRIDVLQVAAGLLAHNTDVIDVDGLLKLARYVEGQDVDDDPATVLTFTPTTQPTSTTITEGAAQ